MVVPLTAKDLPPAVTRFVAFQFPVSVETKLSFVEPGHRWAHSPSPSKAPGISQQGIMKTSVKMLKTSGGLWLLYGASFCFLRRFHWAPEGFFFLWTMTGSPVSCKELSSCGRVPTRGPSSECSLFHSSPSLVIRWSRGGWGVLGLVASYDIRPGDGVGLFWAPEPTRGRFVALVVAQVLSLQ